MMMNMEFVLPDEQGWNDFRPGLAVCYSALDFIKSRKERFIETRNSDLSSKNVWKLKAVKQTSIYRIIENVEATILLWNQQHYFSAIQSSQLALEGCAFFLSYSITSKIPSLRATRPIWKA